LNRLTDAPFAPFAPFARFEPLHRHQMRWVFLTLGSAVDQDRCDGFARYGAYLKRRASDFRDWTDQENDAGCKLRCDGRFEVLKHRFS